MPTVAHLVARARALAGDSIRTYTRFVEPALRSASEARR
jgi:hypothetical protein